MKQLNINLEINKEDFKKKLNIKDGLDGKDGKDGENAIVDYEKLYKILVKRFPKIENKEKTPEEIINDLKGKLSYYDLEDLPDIRKISARDYDFLELKDVPKDYKGQAGKSLVVKTDETGLEFGTGGGSGGVISPGFNSDVNAGAIVQGDLIPDGSDLNSFAIQLLKKTYFPTFVVPSSSLTSNIVANVEAGYIANLVLTMSLNRGSILGDIVGGIWVAGATQDFRSGVANNYTIDGTDLDLVNTKTLTSEQFGDGANTYTASVDYDQGPQPLDSVGDNYSTPLSAGTLNSSLTITGRRNLFQGTDSVSAIAYTTSNEVRALPYTLLNPANGSTFTINIPIGALMVVFAYPDTLQDVSSVKYVEGLNAEVKGIFTKTIVSVEGANAYTPINYKVFTYIPVEAFDAVATYNVTI